MNCRLTYVFLLILCAYTATSQLLPFKHYKTKDGLVSDKVTAVIRDNKGLLWVGTDMGINWFDGYRFVKPALKVRTGELYVTNFFQDSHHRIWILSFYNGIYKYEKGQFINYLPDSMRLESNANSVFDMKEYRDGLFLVATDQGIYWFDGKSFSQFDENNAVLKVQITNIAIVKNKWMFFGHPHGVFIYKYENGHWQFAGEKFSDRAVYKILVTGQQLYMATAKGLFYFNDANELIAQINPGKYFENVIVTDIIRNRADGAFWICADKLFKLEAEQLTPFDISNGLQAIPGKLYIDQEDILWMCSAKGLTKIAKQYYAFYDLRKGPSHSMINSMAFDEKNNLWFGTYDGFGTMREKHFMDHRTINGNKIGYVAWMKNTKRFGLLAGTNAGILSIEKDRIRHKHPIKTSKSFEDKNGVLWTATTDGKVFKLDDGISEIRLSPSLVDFIDAIYKDSYGYLWIGYRANGIRKFEIKGIDGKLVAEYSNTTGYKDLRIRCSYADSRGNLLFGTRTNGLFIISLTDNKRIWQINSADGLAANWIRDISQDENGEIYLATHQGINVLASDYAQPEIRKINLLNEELGEHTTSILPAGNKILIGTEEGLIEYYPLIDKNKSAIPAVYITEVSINGKQDSLLQPYFSFGEKKLETDENFIAFEFAGINLFDDAPLQYRYKLEGYDNNWTDAGERNFVSYHLPPGSYVFKAEAKNSFGKWNTNPASFSFIIPAPFWKTWWFISGIILIVGIVLFFFYRYRVQQALQLERLRHRISTDLHDDIGSTLSSISILSEIASKEKDQQQSGNMMQEIKKNSVTLMEKMDDIVWSINPDNDSMENLMLRIKRFASKLFEAREIDYRIDIDSSIQHAKLDMEARQHIYLIMKEAINNQVKYANCSRSFIGVKYEHDLLEIEISDNGKGFDPDNFQPGNGIISMKKRAEAIGGDFRITSKKGEGTTIRLKTKIK